MTTPLATVAAVCNYALAKTGFKQRVGSLYDGTPQAKRLLDVYGQTRDALLTEIDWDFADVSALPTLLKQAPPNYVDAPWSDAYPALPWRYEYQFPDDALKIRAVKNPPILLPNFDPRYNRFDVSNDNGYSPAKKVILTNVANAIVVYTGQITSPDDWTPAFLDALADRLGQAVAPVLVGLDQTRMMAAERQIDEPIAEKTRA